MKQKEPIKTEDEFNKVINAHSMKTTPEGTHPKASKINLGGGLYVIVQGEKPKRFQFRVCVNGKDGMQRLRTDKEMSFNEARKKADEYQEEVKKARLAAADTNFQAKLAAPSKKKNREILPCFRNMKDAGEFILELKRKINNTKMPEIYLAIWMQLLIPTRINELLSAQTMDFNDRECSWIVARNPNGEAIAIEHLSFPTKSTLERLKELPRLPLNNSYLFPNLFNLDKRSRDQRIAEAVQSIWIDYPIDPYKFKHFLKFVAKKFSNFQPEFIENVIMQRGSDAYWHNNRPQQIALADWWGFQLDRGKHIFDTASTLNAEEWEKVSSYFKPSYNINHNV